MPIMSDAVTWFADTAGVAVRTWEHVRGRPGNEVHRVGMADGTTAYVKAAPGLAAERDRLHWLAGRAPVPQVLAFHAGDVDWLATAALPGRDLAMPEHLADPAKLVDGLAAALRTFHDLDATDCPFGAGPVLTHGDACLPNFLAEDGHVTGYLDLGAAGLGLREPDLAAAVWSLQHNLGPGHAPNFLAAYGMPPMTDDEIEALRLSYETMP
jgi:aminoglycoside phosphotransferase